MKKLIALVSVLAIVTSGCATSGGARPATSPAVSSPASMAEYVRHLPIGSRVRVELAGGRTVKGTLMRADETAVVISPATRVPEPPLDIPLSTVQRIELGRASNLGKTIAIGAAAGAAATFGVLFLLFAMLGD